MDLSPSTTSIGRDDQSWLGSARGTNNAQTVVLTMSAFTAATHYPNGYFPSGLPLGKITATGQYGPYKAGASDGTQNLAGFLLTAIAAPRNSAATVVQGALLDTGRVIVSKVPIITVDATAQATNPRFVYA